MYETMGQIIENSLIMRTMAGNTSMVKMEEILTLIDKRYGYAQDADIVYLMKNKRIPDDDRHLISRRLKYFDLYAKKQGASDYLEIIQNNGKSTKAAKYNKEDIEKLINHPEIKKRIERVLAKKTMPGPGMRIPKCVFHEYVDALSDDKDTVLQESGYTVRQIELFSVPDEYLEERQRELIYMISDLQEELANIDSELKSRR